MWGPSNLLGFEGEQLMGAITINECLHLLYTAYSPLPHLMEKVRATLIAMCDEQPTSKHRRYICDRERRYPNLA
jgi:hypothetical protein